MEKALTREMNSVIEEIVEKVIADRERGNGVMVVEPGKYEIYIRMPPIYPPELEALKVVTNEDEIYRRSVCPSIESIQLFDDSWHKRGFFSQLVSSLLEISWVRFVAVANVVNEDFNRALRLSQSWQLLLDNSALSYLKNEGHLIQNESLTLQKLGFQSDEAVKYGLPYSGKLKGIFSNASSNRLKASCSREVVSKGLFSGITLRPRTADNIFKHFYISK